MHSIQIPNTDLRASEICLGTGDMGGGLPIEASFEILDAYVERGGNFIDTAHVYNDWLPGEKSRSEKLIGAWLKARGRRAGVILATKGGHHPVDGAPYVNRITPVEILRDLEESLRFLQTDVIDLYWLHRDNVEQPVAAILETLEDARQAGKIRYYAASNWRPQRLAEAVDYARQRGIPGLVGDQMLWTLARTDANAIPDKTIMVMDASLYDFHRRTGMAAIPYTSQANGLFSKMAAGTLAGRPDLLNTYPLEPNQALYARIQQVMAQSGLTLTQVVLGWLRSQPFTTIPIVGPKSLAQLADSLSAAGVRLAQEHMELLSA